MMNRYSCITEKNPREILLLRGSGCRWRRCRFCDYHLDFSKDEEENFRLNVQELAKVTGRFGVLETINSGSFRDLDERTTGELLRVCREKEIRRLHIECHWQDRHTLEAIRDRFAKEGIRITVKMGGWKPLMLPFGKKFYVREWSMLLQKKLRNMQMKYACSLGLQVRIQPP